MPVPKEGHPSGTSAINIQDARDYDGIQHASGDAKMKAEAVLKDMEPDVAEAWRVAETEEDL